MGITTPDWRYAVFAVAFALLSAAACAKPFVPPSDAVVLERLPEKNDPALAELKRMRATVDVHSPDRYRANGVVSNMPQFQQAFHCKPGAQMVRQNSCRVW